MRGRWLVAAFVCACGGSSAATPGAEQLVVAPSLPSPAAPVATQQPTAAVVAVASATPEPPPVSDAARAEARDVFRAGVERFNDGSFKAALVKFQKAYALAPLPAVLFNIATCQMQLQRYDEALDTFERYLATLDAASTRAADVRQQISVLKTRLGRP
jgi:tetratricopeptide (TPR) repeat protein